MGRGEQEHALGRKGSRKYHIVVFREHPTSLGWGWCIEVVLASGIYPDMSAIECRKNE
jgi:hypothetical protein